MKKPRMPAMARFVLAVLAGAFIALGAVWMVAAIPWGQWRDIWLAKRFGKKTRQLDKRPA